MTGDPVGTYLRTFEALRAKKRWSEDTTVLRFVALTLASTGLDNPRALRQRPGRLASDGPPECNAGAAGE